LRTASHKEKTMQGSIDDQFVDLSSMPWQKWYYISYCVINLGNKPGVEDRVHNALFAISKCPDDAKAIERFNQFNQQEKYICESLGKKFLAGSLFTIEKGKVREIKLN